MASCGRRSTTASPPRARAGAHVRAARALAEAGAPAERTAEHLLQAQRLGEPWALEALREAGRAALAAGRVSSGIAYLRRALDEDPADAGARSELLAELGEAEAASGDPAGAARLALAAEDALSGGERARTLERLAGALWLLGQDATAAAGLRAARSTSPRRAATTPQAARLRAGLLLTARFDPELRVRTIERLAPSLREPGFGREREPALDRLGGVRARARRTPRRARGRPGRARARGRARRPRRRARARSATPPAARCSGPTRSPPPRSRSPWPSRPRAGAATPPLPPPPPASAPGPCFSAAGSPHAAADALEASGAEGDGPVAGDTRRRHDPGRDRHGAGHGSTRPRSRSTTPRSRPRGETARGTPSTWLRAAASTTSAATTRRPSRSCSRAAASWSRSASTTRPCCPWRSRAAIAAAGRGTTTAAR